MPLPQGYITLDSVITDYLNESEQSLNKYFKLFHLAFRGFEQLGIDFFYRVITVKIPVAANKTAKLPVDYMNWVKVGILNDTGGIIPLWYNNNLTTYADTNSDRLNLINDPQSAWLQWGWDGVNGNTWCNYWNNGYTNVYGVPSGEPFVGSFKVDVDNGVILLNETFDRDYIMLEYLSSPVTTQVYNLPVCFREAVIAWLWWKDGNARPVKSHMQISARQNWRHEFYNERRLAIARFKPHRDSEAYQASQEQSRLAIKT